MTWFCYECQATGNPSGFAATTRELEEHFATATHQVKNAMGVIAPERPRERCQHGWYTYGGPKGDRTRVEVGPHLLVGQEIAESSSWERIKEGVTDFMTGGYYLGAGGMYGSSHGKARAISQLDMVKQDHEFTVIDTHMETPYTISILTDFPPEWNPGQFGMLGVPGCGEVPISFSGTAGDDGGTPCYTVQTIRNVGRVTGAIAKLRPGAKITQRGPFGRGWNYQGVSDLLMVAGGCGIAPLRPVIEDRWYHDGQRASARGNEYSTIIYGAKNEEDFYFKDETWFQDAFRITDKDGYASDRIQPWMIEDDTVALVCGPERMMKACALKLVDLGVKPENIQVSLERKMICGLGICGVCGVGGGRLCCKDGPVFTWAELEGKL